VPLARRALQAAGVLSLLLILVVVNALLRSGENPLNPVAAAAGRTEDVGGLRFTMKIVKTSEAHSPEIGRGAGALNAETNRARAFYTVPTPEGTIARVEAVIEEDAIYFRSPMFDAKLPPGRKWVKMNPLEHHSESSMPGESPDTSLEMMGASDSVHLSGHRRVRGVQTRRYVTRFEMAEIAGKLRSEGQDELAESCERFAQEAVGPVRAEAFVDDEGLLRRIGIEMTTIAEGPAETADMTMDFFDFGAHPDVQPPPSSEVFDMTHALEGQQETFGRSS
jgi:hypothetical protein